MIKLVIPARLQSSRLPEKMLQPVAGVPLIVRTAQAVARGPYPYLVAYDDERIGALLRAHDIPALATSPAHQNGTERLGEVVRRLDWPDDTIVVNVQGDEPLLPPAAIDLVIKALQENGQAQVATLATATDERDNPNVVKVVCNNRGEALYFSRAPIPYDRDGHGANYLRHIGLYGYRARLLKDYAQLQASPLEHYEKLEQLRFLANGQTIAVALIDEAPPAGVDSLADLRRVEALFQQ